MVYPVAVPKIAARTLFVPFVIARCLPISSLKIIDYFVLSVLSHWSYWMLHQEQGMYSEYHKIAKNYPYSWPTSCLKNPQMGC